MRELVCSHTCEPNSLWHLNARPVHPALLQVASTCPWTHGATTHFVALVNYVHSLHPPSFFGRHWGDSHQDPRDFRWCFIWGRQWGPEASTIHTFVHFSYSKNLLVSELHTAVWRNTCPTYHNLSLESIVYTMHCYRRLLFIPTQVGGLMNTLF